VPVSPEKPKDAQDQGKDPNRELYPKDEGVSRHVWDGIEKAPKGDRDSADADDDNYQVGCDPLSPRHGVSVAAA
jgi:hypothetical protein